MKDRVCIDGLQMTLKLSTVHDATLVGSHAPSVSNCVSQGVTSGLAMPRPRPPECKSDVEMHRLSVESVRTREMERTTKLLSSAAMTAS